MTKPTILVIDDNKMSLRLSKHVFERAGYEVHLAENGSEGLAKANEIKPNVIILDIMMPDVDGLQVCEKLRANRSTARIPIIILSAKGEIEDKLSGFEAGADDYVQKPVAPRELVARANALLERVRRAQPSKARIITVVGVKGGVGTTTVAVNVATWLVSQNKSVILAELHPHRGTVTHNLNMTPAQDLGNLLTIDPNQLNHKEVARRVVQHVSGLRVLAAPQQATEHPLTAAHVEAIIEILSQEVDYVILDLPNIASEAMRQALDLSDQILMVTEPETISIACTKADLETLKTWSIFDRTNLVVVSRAPSNTLIAPREIEKLLGIRVISVLPPAPELFYLAASLGNPVVSSKPDSVAADTFIKLGDVLLERLPVAS